MTQSSGFGKFVPGFDFLQNLAEQAASGVTQGISQNLPQIPNLSNWVAPTFNVEELEKRIDELRAVHFWLDQNAKALGATIQALEVQKMTLATLKTMNFSLGDVANALKIKAADAVAGLGVSLTPEGKPQFAGLEVPERTYDKPAPAPEPEPAPVSAKPARKPPARKKATSATRVGEGAAGVPAGVVDPMQWWGAVSQQFQQIASSAMKDVAKQGVLDATQHMASELTGQAVKTAADMAGKAAGTVGRNMGVAAGVGKAAARAVTGQGTSRKAPAAPRKKAGTPAPARRRASR